MSVVGEKRSSLPRRAAAASPPTRQSVDHDILKLMGKFDYYREAADIAQQLEQVGCGPVAAAIRQAMSSSSTGAEAFMKLHHLLTPLKGEALPDFVGARVRRLWLELDAALKAL